MTCIAWNPASDPFMFATGSHDGSVQIWTTPEVQPRPAFPTLRTEVSAPQPAVIRPGVVNLAVPVLREPSRRYTPIGEEDSPDTIVKYVPPRETLTVVSEPLNTLAARRHSWV